MLGVSWVWGRHGILWLSGSGGGDGVPSGVSWGRAWLILSGGLVSVNADILLWESVAVLLKSKLEVESMSWIWGSHSILWLSGSGAGDSVPGRVSWGRAGFILSSSFIGVNADILLWKSVSILLLEELKVESMSWVWGSHSILWLSGSGGGDGVPSRVSWSTAGFILSSGLVSINADIGLRKCVSSCVLFDARGRDGSEEESNN